MDTLKKTCIKNKRLIGIVLLAVAVVVCLWRASGIFKMIGIEKITADSDLSKLEGKMVSYDMVDFLDVYEDITDSKNKPKYTGYVVYAANDEKLFSFGLWRRAALDDEMEKFFDEYNPDNPKVITVKGILVKMDSVDKGYMNEVADLWAEEGYDINPQYYYIFEDMTDAKGKHEIAEVMIFAGICGVIFVIGLVLIITAGFGWDKKLKTYAAMNMTSLSQMEMDIQGGTFFANGAMIVGTKTFYYATGSKAEAVRLDNICWGYHEYRRSGRTTLSEMVLCDTAGKRKRISAAEPVARDVLNNMVKKCPWIIVGFRADWDSMFKSSLDEFLKLHYYDGKQQSFGGASPASSYVDPFEEYNRKMDEAQQADVRREMPSMNPQPTEEKKSTGFEDFASWSQRQNNNEK